MTEETHPLTADQLPRAEHLGATLYAAGYTEPYLRQFWGGAVSDALTRTNAAPALHHCRSVLDDSLVEVIGSGAARLAPAESAGESPAESAGESPAESGGEAGADALPPLSGDERLAAITLVFWLREQVPAIVLAAALGLEAYRAARDLGLVEEVRPDGVTLCARAPFALTPYEIPVGVPRGLRRGDENLYLVADHGTLTSPEVLPGDFVLGLGGAGRTLVSITPRDRVTTAADIGTGCGVQALLLARHVERVIATDISARALHLTALSAGLAGVTNIDLRQGSLLEPLTEDVDLLVSNPPFVITPRTAAEAVVPDFEYRDGGMSGDRLVRELFAEVPSVLTAGGRAVCLGNWEVTADSSDGPETWVVDPSTSVLVIEREVLDPVAYAETWIRDGGIQRASEEWNAATAAWLDDFASRQVTGIAFGYVLMHRTDNDSPTLSPDDLPSTEAAAVPAPREKVRITSAQSTNTHGIGAFLTTVEELRSWLAQASDEEIAATAFTRSPDLVEHRHHVPGQEDPTSITLEQGIGFGQVFDLDTALAGFVSVADGSLTLRQTAAALAQLLDVDAAALEAQLIAQVRGLVGAGALLPGTP